ncbi:MAG: hypothetical protein R2748_30550 [Bryobacterales bacterium]
MQGQNPTRTRRTIAPASPGTAFGAATTTDTTVGYDRLGSCCCRFQATGPPSASVPEITGPAPPPPIPIDRAQNRFRYGSTLRHVRNRHTLTAGFALTKLFYNGEETDGHRVSSFNRSVENGVEYSAIDNLRRVSRSSSSRLWANSLTAASAIGPTCSSSATSGGRPLT